MEEQADSLEVIFNSGQSEPQSDADLPEIPIQNCQTHLI